MPIILLFVYPLNKVIREVLHLGFYLSFFGRIRNFLFRFFLFFGPKKIFPFSVFYFSGRKKYSFFGRTLYATLERGDFGPIGGSLAQCRKSI